MRPFQHLTIVFGSVMAMLVVTCIQYQLSWWWLVIVALVYVHFLVLGAIFIRWNFYVQSFGKGTNKLWVSLTFDDGPAKYTQPILDILAEKQVPATFFAIGKNVVAHPEVVKRWDHEGHLIGNHSYGHGFNFDWQSTKEMTKEIESTNDVIASIIGKRPRLFRPPYGVTNPNLAKAINRAKMHSIAWNIRSFDTKSKDPDQLLNRILDRLSGGDIILLHDSMGITHEILTELIERTQQNGFTFVPLDKMLDIHAYS
ncbi:MAG: polysaccharide deacetylase family protein [Bacteroidetes bacterium]|nr:polysaccharide deacetylase family protein [Bacteroidota bacterium]